MKWRHWSILIILVLLNYIIFSTAFTQLARQRNPAAIPTRTPQPTFVSMAPKAVSWVVLPTSTVQPTPTSRPPLPTPTMTEVISQTETLVPEVEATEAPTASPPPTDAPEPTPTATAQVVTHVVRRGEYLSLIAQEYGVSSRMIADANNLGNPNLIITGQTLIIPSPGQMPAADQPAATLSPESPAAPTRVPPTATPKPKPPTATPTAPPTPTTVGSQFTANVVWHPLVAPNCAGPGIAKESVIQDLSGSPINGVRVEVDCYGTVMPSDPSGTPGVYDPGHYDVSFGQTEPQAWTCTARVFDLNGQPVASSQTATIQFDTNDCRPGGIGHQVAIVNWTKHW
ncbi:MAG: LysM peptidoglycan-binding domain-containing protein [Anaerolineae bacterium]|nr:LysM peptidoglycan-binding domain-containing protein [Anaerolineae bacterium]